MTAQPGINLIGHLSTNLGLGVAARNTARLLADESVPFCVVDIPTATIKPNADRIWEPYYHTGKGPAPYNVNLFHFNPTEIVSEIRLRPRWLETAGRLNAVVPFWELSRLPDSWMGVMERVDTVLAPTRFIAKVVRDSIDHPDVVHFPQTVYLPDDVRPDRTRWGLLDDEIAFIVAFDVNSDPSRKNPWAAVHAYQLARESFGATKTRLLIKVNNAHTRMGAAHMAELRELAEHDETVSIIAQSLSYRDVLSLYAAADVYVSLHRSEGLGLGMLESMMLGTPIIATAYSGNLDFMTPENSLPVSYEMIPVEATELGSYAARKIGENQLWADPSVKDAAGQMVRMATQPALRASLAKQAKTDALATQDSPERSAAIQHLLARAGEHLPQSRLSELEQGSPLYWRARRMAGARLRDRGLR